MSWKDNKNLGPWNFTEQRDKFGYVNNPRWTTTVNERHFPDGYWYKVKPYKTTYSYKDEFPWSDGNGYWISDNGQIHVVKDYPNDYNTTTLWISRDYGQNWKDVIVSGGCSSSQVVGFDMSYDGHYMVALVDCGSSNYSITVSRDYGQTWEVVYSSVVAISLRVAISGNGKYIIVSPIMVGGFNRYQLRSDNYGKDWVVEECIYSDLQIKEISYTGQLVTYGKTTSSKAYIYNSYAYGIDFNVIKVYETTELLKNTIVKMSKGVDYTSGKYITLIAKGGWIVRSENYGVAGSWEKFRLDYPHINYPGYFIGMSDEGKYQMVSGWSRIYLSKNYGKEGSWNCVLGPISKVGYYGGMDETGNIMFVINDVVNKVHRSFDMGNNWKTSGTHTVETISVDKPSIPIVWETE